MFWFYLQISSETFLTMRRNERDVIKTYIARHVTYPSKLSDFKENWILEKEIFQKYSNIKFDENPSCGSQIVPSGQKKGKTDMTKLTVVPRNYANVPKE